MTMPNDDLTDYRLATVEDAVKSIADNLNKLTILEQKHLETREALTRAFTQITNQDERIRTMEAEMPTLKLVRAWVIAGVIGITTLVGIAVARFVIDVKPVTTAAVVRNP